MANIAFKQFLASGVVTIVIETNVVGSYGTLVVPSLAKSSTFFERTAVSFRIFVNVKLPSSPIGGSVPYEGVSSGFATLPSTSHILSASYASAIKTVSVYEFKTPASSPNGIGEIARWERILVTIWALVTRTNGRITFFIAPITRNNELQTPRGI